MGETGLAVRDGERSFAVVCDSGCDLSANYLKQIGVVMVPLCVDVDGMRHHDEATRGDDRTYLDMHAGTTVTCESPSAEDFLAVYQSLAEAGVRQIASVHSADFFVGVPAAAQEAAMRVDAQVEVVDTGAASLATGFVVDRLAALAKAGADFEQAVSVARELSSITRLLVIPSASARMPRKRPHRVRVSVVRTYEQLHFGMLAGERGLFLLSDGDVTEMARSGDLPDLTDRLARAMSFIAADAGPLIYGEVETGDLRALRTVEKSLEDASMDARSLGAVRAAPSTAAVVGLGAVAIAFMPAEYYQSVSRRFSVPSIDAAAADYLG